MNKKLYRDEYHKKLAGVCAGLAEYFNVDVTIVRVLFILALIFHGGGLLIYIVLWIALPKKPYVINEPNVDYRVPSQTPDSNNTSGGNPFQNQPFPVQPSRNNTSLVAIIFGVLLIMIGSSILLDEFDILPDWDFEQLWPIILIVIGGALMISGEKKKQSENLGQDKTTAAPDNKPTEAGTSEENPPADNEPTV